MDPSSPAPGRMTCYSGLAWPPIITMLSEGCSTPFRANGATSVSAEGLRPWLLPHATLNRTSSSIGSQSSTDPDRLAPDPNEPEKLPTQWACLAQFPPPTGPAGLQSGVRSFPVLWPLVEWSTHRPLLHPLRSPARRRRRPGTGGHHEGQSTDRAVSPEYELLLCLRLRHATGHLICLEFPWLHLPALDAEQGADVSAQDFVHVFRWDEVRVITKVCQ